MKTILPTKRGSRVSRAISLQHRLARPVERMRLAGEDELHGHLRVIDERGERLEILQQQVGALVGGEPAREPDGQRVRAERAAELRDEAPRARPAARPAAPRAACTS